MARVMMILIVPFLLAICTNTNAEPFFHSGYWDLIGGSGLDICPDSEADSTSETRKFLPRFFVTYDLGKESSMPCWPETKESVYGGGGESVSGYGFGVGGDFRVERNFALIFDIGYHSWRYQVGEEGSRSTSFWVFEQTDYSSYYTGTFETDAFFYMNATIVKLGVRYFFDLSREFEPWVAVTYGMAAWKVDFLTADKSKSFGNDSGTAYGPSCMIGVDIHTAFTMGVFLEIGSPVAKPVEVENLFYDGWTWNNTAGQHAVLPYRIGVSIGM